MSEADPQANPEQRIAIALEEIDASLKELPNRIAASQQSSNLSGEMIHRMKESFERSSTERKAAQAERRATIAIALAGVTALASLLAAIAELIRA